MHYSVIKTYSKQMSPEHVLKRTSFQLHELLLVDCSIELGRTQRRLYRQNLFFSNKYNPEKANNSKTKLL